MSSLANLSAEQGVAQMHAPGSALTETVGADGLMMLCMVLAVIAFIAVLSTISDRRKAREAARQARQQGEAMRDLLRSVRMAESIAGVGVWQYDHVAQVQQWSEGLKRLFGIDSDAKLVEGDAETLLYANDIDLVGKVCQHSDKIEPFTLEFEIFGFDSIPRSISVQACNLRNADGAVQRVVAVVRDVTRNIEARIEAAREWDAIDDGAPQMLALRRPVKQDRQGEADELTGLANRRRFMGELDRLVVEARQSRRSLVLVMFDIDHFKRVNDVYGSEEGDKILQRIAHLAERLQREHDVIGRVAGQQFAWIISRATEGSARIMAERLRQSIARSSGVGAVPPVTTSLGSASLQTGDTALSLFARADDALSAAKHSGRNRVRVAA